MDMRLYRMIIRNFMGCKELSVDFNGVDMRVYGDNGTGKTTLQHAFNWLLFDKNAYGKADFGIKPYDASGEVIHRLETSVEACFLIDGFAKEFKKVLKEKWTRKRGSAEETYSGNEVDYYVNTIPKKKKEFTEEIAKLIDESVFRMITNPLYFNEHIDWKERRKMLMDICGDISDEEIIRSKKELIPLLSVLKGRTVEELKSMVSSEMKTINKELGIIPSRIAEAEMAKPTPRDDVDTSALEGLEEKLYDLRQKKADILNGAEIIRINAEMDVLKKELQAKKSEAFKKHEFKENAEYVAIYGEKTVLVADAKSLKTIAIPKIDAEIESNRRKKNVLSHNWDGVFKRTFLGSTCPTCKRELPADEVEEKRNAFNADKAMELDAIEEKLKDIKKSDVELAGMRSGLVKKLEDAEARIAVLDKRSGELDGILAQMEQDFIAKRDKAVMEMTSKLNDLRNAITEQELNAEELAAEVEQEIQEVERQKKPITDFIAEQAMVAKQDARILDLKDQQKTLSGKYTELERQLFLTEEFIRCKVSMISERINSHFEYARFKLFTEQVNGGIAETCEVTYKGVPYRDLNSAGRINIGLDIINTLSLRYDASCPIFIDNMESITKPICTTAQRIELYVSGADKKLRFEEKGE